MIVTIVNLNKQKPSKVFDFCVGRGTPLGNPVVLLDEALRDSVCDVYDQRFTHLLNHPPAKMYLDSILAALRLHGRVRLFCWCAPKRCHAETIKNWLEAQ